PSWAGLTQPATTSSIWSSPTPTRSHAPRIANPSRSSSRICDSEPPYRVNGVRTPPSTNASVIIDSLRSRRTTDVTHDLDRLAQRGQPGVEGVSRRIEPDGVDTGVAPDRQPLPHHGFGADQCGGQHHVVGHHVGCAVSVTGLPALAYLVGDI